MKSNYWIKTNLSTVQKICLCGLFIALAIILQKVIAVNYISFIPFVRISFGGPAIIILCSLILGPFYGLLCGTFSDILGYFIFDPKTLGFFPSITLIYSFLGFFSYFIFCSIKRIRNKNLMRIIEYATFLILELIVSLFFIFNSKLTLFSNTYTFDIYQRVFIPLGLFALLMIIVLFTELMDKRDENYQFLNVRQISFSLFLIELLIMVIFGSLMKAVAFGFQTFLVIFLSQSIVGVFNVFLNTILISYIMKIVKRFFINE